MQVPHRVEDLRHLGVEDTLRVGRLCRLPGEAVSEKPQSLDWVDGVHRDLQRQMHIILVEKNERLLDKYSPLIEGQFPGVAEKIRQQSRGAQLLPDRLSRRAQKGWSLLRHSTIYCV